MYVKSLAYSKRSINPVSCLEPPSSHSVPLLPGPPWPLGPFLFSLLCLLLGALGRYLRELPVKLHPLGFGVAALDEPRPAVDVHQAPVVVIVNRGAQDAHVDLLPARVVHILGVGEKEVTC